MTRPLTVAAVLAAIGCGDADRAARPAVPSARGAAPGPTASGAAGEPARDGRPVAGPRIEPADPIEALRAWEDDARAHTDFASLPPSSATLGPDPYAIVRFAPDRFAIALRGADALAVVDAAGRPLQRLPAPPSPTALAAAGDTVYAVGELTGALHRYEVAGGRLRPAGTVDLGDVRGARALAVAGDRLLVAEEVDGRVLSLAPDGGERRELFRCHGPMRLVAAGRAVWVDCLLDHALVAVPLAGGPPRARIVHDGPLWSVDAVPRADGWLVAAGGVEDHPLERKNGSFGYIDSFLYLYAVDRAGARRLAAVNLSEVDAVTPKWVSLASDGRGARVWTAGYAGERWVELTWTDLAAPPAVRTGPLPPGTSAAAPVAPGRFVAANPLLDAWVAFGDGAAPRIVPATDAPDPRDPEVRVGEALLFTKLMAPWNPTDGRASRFTCETCHYEGYADGRVHYTGRADIHASTKPLLGLFNNRPYFSRALDKTMARMVHAEFRVANKTSPRGPWFSLDRDAHPWLRTFGDVPAKLSPVFLRRSFMHFLMVFSHRPNPLAAGRTAFSPVERAGAAVFRDRCAGCHAPRLIAEDPASAVPFERWEALVLSPSGPIVWATADYHKTGVTPYPHPNGTRVFSLRRLYKRWPYFTNGSAKSLDDVLARAAWRGDTFYHDGAPADAERLSAGDRAALRAFLRLL
ncbi:MAG: hypothetical protein D6689_19510 [Deltaproteobacteria bacterium]|nr:MAG: hypothetical protein D6689_19510 [Deltaproteobacteria bacterium]